MLRRAGVQEWEETKQRQDQQLEHIETGLGHLKEIGEAMNEELQRHDILINEVDEKMDKVTKELQTNNMRLKGLVTKVGRGAGQATGRTVLFVSQQPVCRRAAMCTATVCPKFHWPLSAACRCGPPATLWWTLC